MNTTTRRYIVAVDLATGAVRTFNPNPQSQVYGIAMRGNSLYIGGVFNAVGNVAASRLAMVDKTTGVLDPTFNPAPDGAVRTFAFSPNGARIYVGGDYANIAGAAQQWLVALEPGHRRLHPRRVPALPGPRARPRRRSGRDTRCTARSPASLVAATAPIAWNANTGARAVAQRGRR